MARDRQLFKARVNRMLDRLEALAPGTPIETSEAELAALLEASRTTARAVLAHLGAIGILAQDGRTRRLLRRPRSDDRFAADVVRSRDQIEARFLDWTLQTSPG